MERKFLRQNWFLHAKLGLKWRKPKGKQSKMRRNMKGNTPMPSIGYSKNKHFRNLVKGYRTIVVSSVKDVDAVSPGYAIIIASCVGKKKSLYIENRATEKGLKILNLQKIHAAKQQIKKIEKKKVEAALKAEKSQAKQAVKSEAPVIAEKKTTTAPIKEKPVAKKTPENKSAETTLSDHRPPISPEDKDY